MNSLTDEKSDNRENGFDEEEFFRKLNNAVNETILAKNPVRYAGTERRNDLRLKRRMRMKINGQPALLIDISRKGMRISTSELPRDPQVDITLFTENDDFELEGEIRWYSKKDSLIKHREMGIYFESVPERFSVFMNSLFEKAAQKNSL